MKEFIRKIKRSKRRQYLLAIGLLLMVCICMFIPSTVFRNYNNSPAAIKVPLLTNNNTQPTLIPSTTPTEIIQPTYTSYPTYTPYPTFTVEVIPTATSMPTVDPVTNVPGAECIPRLKMEIGKVKSITDGDTIRVIINGKEFPLRYIGMDAPETSGDYFANEATSYNVKLVSGKDVLLFTDVSNTDRYDRLLRYVVADGKFVNYELVKNGYASAYTYPPDVACSGEFMKAQTSANTNNLGLWAIAAIPAIIPPAANPGIVSSGNCDPSYPDVCIPPYPPDLDCGEINFKRFRVLPPDPHGFDRDHDGIGCES